MSTSPTGPADPHPRPAGAAVPRPGPGDGAAGDPLVATSLRGWFSAVVGVVRRSWRLLVAIHGIGGLLVVGVATVLLMSVSTALDRARVPGWDEAALYAIVLTVLAIVVVALTVSTVALCVSTSLVLHRAAGRSTSVGAAFAVARGRAPRLAGWMLAVLSGCGYLLLLSDGSAAEVLPGLALVLLVYLPVAVVVLSTFVGVVVLERRDWRRMVALVRRDLPATTARVLPFLVVAGAYAGTLTAVIRVVADATTVGVGDTTGVVVFFVLFAVLVQMPLGVVALAVSLVTYAGLRHREDPGVGTAQLVAELGR